MTVLLASALRRSVDQCVLFSFSVSISKIHVGRMMDW